MGTPRRPMVISHWWAQIAILTFLIGFVVLGIMAYKVYTQHPPIPEKVVSETGATVFTGQDIQSGQQVFRRYGLMQHGTIFGHGAYLGPDFTADYLHRASEAMLAFYAGEPGAQASPLVRQRVRDDLKRNTWNPQTRTITYSPGQVHAWQALVAHYTNWFGPRAQQEGLMRPQIDDPQEIRDLTSYFSWAAWACTTNRPGANYSYTNNWPAEPAAANAPTGDAVLWSALSLVALLCGAGVIFFLFGRYDWLGWHSAPADREQKVVLSDPGSVALTPSQRMTAWYFLVVAGLFLAQGLLGGANAHFHAAPEGIGGAAVAQWLPYNLTRTWHVQLALFFIVASFLALGIFIAPMIARREPKHQGTLALVMFVARYFVPADRPSNWAMGISFWSLNIGLACMIFVNLVPVGFLQFQDSLENGYWHARSPEFFAQPLVQALEWARLPGDVLFIVGGILPIVYLALRTFLWRNRPATVAAGESADKFVRPPS